MDSITITDAQLGNSTWNVYYSSENRQKRIEWASGATFTRVNKLYSALQDLFDELTQMDDGVVMSAQTPTEYTIGIIDPGDKDPWFIDRTSVEHLTGGALKTNKWLRNDDVAGGTDNTGIVRVNYTVGGTDFDVTDIGRDIKDTTDNDIGTLLDFNTVASTKVAWIRPDSTAQANSFDSTAGHTLAIQNDSISSTQRWDNSLGTFGTDETVDANSATNADWTVFRDTETPATDDYVAIGYSLKFKKAIFDNANGTAGAGAAAIAWEYYNGSTWAALSGVSDGTSSFKAAASDGQVLTFTVPSDWARTSLNGSQQLFYIRARITSGTYTTVPIYDQGFIGATGSVTQTAAAAVSGESLWANIYTLGTIERYTHIYVYQNGAYLNAYKSTTSDWWGDQTTGQLDTTGTVTDHIDILINVQEVGTEVDEGWVKVFARQYSKTFSYYSVDLITTAGVVGRNPIPLQTGNDLDNQTGFQKLTLTASASSFNVGNYIYWTNSGALTWTTTTKRAKITAVSGNDITYYYIGEPITQFSANDTVIQEYIAGTGDGDGTGTINGSAPVNAGPATTTEQTFFDTTNPPTATFGGRTTGGTEDIDENGTAENYSISIDCNQNAVSQVYQWTKYIARRGNSSDIINGTPSEQGQFYVGSDTRVAYDTLTGTIADGDVVTQVTSGFTGTVVNHNTTDKILILRNSRGTFNQTNNIQKDGSNYVTITGSAPVAAITPIASAPFGTFAGGKFFTAPGIVLTDYKDADGNNFQLTDDAGNVVVAPTKVTITVGNTRAGDKVAVFRLTAAGGDIKKDKYNATVQSVGSTTAVMGATITTDEPGRNAGGVLRLVDVSANTEYRIRFGSWSGTTFKLYGHADHGNTTGLTANGSGGNATVLVDTGTSFTTTVKVGDIIRNITEDKIAYVVAVDSDTQLTTTAVTNWNGDQYEINTLPVATTTSPQDTWYVPFIDSYETTGTDGTPGTETAQLTYSANIPVRVRARRSTVGSSPILPYESDSTVTNTGMTVSIVRTADTIIA